MKARILIVEDQFIEANALKLILEVAGYTVCTVARSVQSALKIIREEYPDMVLIDIFLQGNQTGIDLALQLKERNIAFVYISANSNRHILDAAKATKPYGFLVKPFREKDVLVMLDVAWYLHQQNQEALNSKKNGQVLPTPPTGGDEIKDIIAGGPDMLDILNSIKLVGPLDVSVLILGESGTGKELVARSIHRVSSRNEKPFVVVNCGALPANLIESELFGHEKGAFTGAVSKRLGKFEQADKGTIFLDEVGELPLDLQVKFLRVLQEKEIEPIGGQSRKIDVRVIAATNRNLEEEIAGGRFRIDLYYRLNVFPLMLPPLRERKSDIILLANYFLKLSSQAMGKHITGFSDNVIKQMLEYSWPGNIREMEHLIQRTVLLAKNDIIDDVHLPSLQKNLPATSHNDRNSIKTIDENEREYILKILKLCKGKITGKDGAAGLLGVPPSTLHSKMRRLGITKEFFS